MTTRGIADTPDFIGIDLNGVGGSWVSCHVEMQIGFRLGHDAPNYGSSIISPSGSVNTKTLVLIERGSGNVVLAARSKNLNAVTIEDRVHNVTKTEANIALYAQGQ